MKLFKMLAIAALVMLVAAGSVFAGGGSQSSGSSSGGQKTVTLLVDADSPFVGTQAMIDAFQKKTGIKVEVEIRVGGLEGENIMKTRLATGDMADMFWYNTGSKLNDLNPAQNIQDISNEPFAANVTDSFKKSASANGKLYGLPMASTQAGAILYNKKIYQDLGLSVPHTWNDFIVNCEKIQASGKVAIVASNKTTWTSQLFFLGDEYNVKASQPNFPAEYTANRAKYATNAVARKGFEKIAAAGKYLNRDHLATTYELAEEMIANGQAAHWAILTQALTSINTDYPSKINDIGVFGIPGDDPNNHGLTVWIPSGLYIYKNTPNLDLAKQWAAYTVSDEGIGVYSSVQKPDGPFALKGVNLPSTVYAGVQEMVAYFNANKTDVALEFESPVKGPNLEQFCIEVFSGITTPQAAATAYDQDVTKQAIQLNLPGW
ncbi:ABC transporter substrate-binding protein [Leadbettera azotonutricia]|uniref:Extracellular solute-binding protein family 1 n=1 Tax=Leadbettera azotonutricia (strain ATCC BAA-888 / DSM 13862 / ZAS-9) TaxID=545695 RepID=F5YF37_LEAAZ|nr:ABC transporter substrate-binding protein [Leadbettera azotonutricia]AEF81504.1 extracellular solute-binding protein family 1 [Leadbettera azotonutricia ZAS-9]